MRISRRELLRQGFSLLAVGMATPTWLARVATADQIQIRQGQPLPNRRVLVVVQLTGGNDGLNTVIPYTNSRYRQLRPTLAIAENEVLPLDDHIGLHPSWQKVKELIDQGHFAIVQGVGYPNPNRSHFRSLEIWQTAVPERVESTGWLGRYLDTLPEARRHPVVGIVLGREMPVAMTGKRSAVPCLVSLEEVASLVGTEAKVLRELYRQQGTSTEFIREAARQALDAAETLSSKLADYRAAVQYPSSTFGRTLQQVAQLIVAELGIRVFYCTTGGFDTHAQQARTHATLLRNVAEALHAFWHDLLAQGKAHQVLVLVFSEFGRRVAENGSAGTDHGAAAPIFMLSTHLQPGLHGEHPSLDALQDGDLRYHIDFRSVYATVLEDWLQVDPVPVLGGAFRKVPLWRSKTAKV